MKLGIVCEIAQVILPPCLTPERGVRAMSLTALLVFLLGGAGLLPLLPLLPPPPELLLQAASMVTVTAAATTATAAFLTRITKTPP